MVFDAASSTQLDASGVVILFPLSHNITLQYYLLKSARAAIESLTNGGPIKGHAR
jgi:hypothetical protein